MSRDYGNEINFREAYDHAHLAWTGCELSDKSRSVLDRCNEEELYGMVIDADLEMASSGNKGSTLSTSKQQKRVVRGSNTIQDQ